jgi:hypothetical protein
MNPDSTPPVAMDAGERAWRTLVQGLAVDVTAAVAVALSAAIAGGITWTQSYWLALGLAVGKSALTAGLSYAARRLVPPASTLPDNSGGA